MYLTLAKFLIDRPVVTNVLAIMLFSLGLASALQIKRLGYPNVDFKQIAISSTLPGASPEGIELNITTRLEDAIRDVDGIDSFSSESSEGLSRITVKIDPDVPDIEKVKTDIRNAIDSVTDLPDEMQARPQIFELKNENFSIYEAALTSKSGNSEKLHVHAQNLKTLIQQIPDVTRVYEAGATEPEIHINVDAERLRFYNVSLNQVVAAVQQNLVRLGAGELETNLLNKSIITVSEFEDLNQLRNLVVRGTASGPAIKISQLGQVLSSQSKRTRILSYNGKPGRSLWVVKKGSADVIDTIAAIKDEVAAYQAQQNDPDLEVFSTWDMSIDTKNRLRIVSGNVALGFFLVVLVLFLFLDWRVAIWAGLGIPISIAVAALIMPLLDISINTISLCGMVVVLGMVVDDAIIIAESIYRQIEAGKTPAEAAYTGLTIVIRPVLGTILTTIVAFYPIYYIPGLLGSFSHEIPSVVIIMLIASFIEATLMLPCHLAHGRTQSVPRKPPLAWLMEASKDVYKRLLRLTLQHRYGVAGGFTALIFLANWFTLGELRFNMFPRDQAFRIFVRCELAEGTALPETAKASQKIEAMVRSYGDIVHSTKTTAGQRGRFGGSQASAISMVITMTQATEREIRAFDFHEMILQRLRSDEFEYITKVDSWIATGGPYMGRPIEIRIIGNDNAARLQAVQQVKDQLPHLYLTEISDDNEPGKQQIFVEPRIDAMSRAGVTSRTIATTIRTAFNGTIAGYRQTTDDRIPYRIQLDEKSQNFASPLRGLYVENQFGNLVRLEPLVNQTIKSPPRTVRHHNGDRLTTITANVDLGKSTPKAVHEQLNKYLSGFSKKFPGLRAEVGGEGEESSKMVKRIYVLLAAAVAAIYLILVVQFNSLTQPVMVLLGIPFGWIGIAVAFSFQNIDMSLLAAVGAVGFCGVVVNDSLIMVDYINQLRKRADSLPFLEQVIAGASVRFRPVMLTTVSTVAGLIPTAYGLIGGLDAFISPLVMAMMWGLLAGTPSILFIIPCLYAINNDLGALLRRVKA